MKKNLARSLAVLLGVIAGSMWMRPVHAEQGTSMQSIVDEAVIRRLPFESEHYMMKSDGFYCLNEDGTLHSEKAVHYFSHYEMEGTIWDGFYYHDESGKWKAANPALVQIPAQQVPVSEKTEMSEADSSEVETESAVSFEGWYMANNLGKLSGTGQVHYLMDFQISSGNVLDGYYYFDEYGALVTEPGIHFVEKVSNGRYFEGEYYFGGKNGALVTEAGETPEGIIYDENGRVADTEEIGTSMLYERLKSLTGEYQGKWSIYVKNLDTEDVVVLRDVKVSSASLIKTYVMAKTYRDYDEVRKNLASQMQLEPESDKVAERLQKLLSDMITVSDNESYNELVRLQSPSHDFLEGAAFMNEFLKEEGFSHTTVQSSLSPSQTKQVSLGGKNKTSVSDCAKLLEEIERGQMVSAEASASMKELLLAQSNRTKIPTGLPQGVLSANKTGETDSCQHDAAIVYGKDATFVLCIMSSEITNEADAVNHIREIASTVYAYLNYE